MDSERGCDCFLADDTRVVARAVAMKHGQIRFLLQILNSEIPC